MHATSLQLCLTLCDALDYSPPGSSVHGILQARILEWVAIPFSRGSSWPRDQTQVSHIAGKFFTVWAVGKCHLALCFYITPGKYTDFNLNCLSCPRDRISRTLRSFSGSFLHFDGNKRNLEWVWGCCFKPLLSFFYDCLTKLPPC